MERQYFTQICFELAAQAVQVFEPHICPCPLRQSQSGTPPWYIFGEIIYLVRTNLSLDKVQGD